MQVALLISGEPRTCVFKEQITFFEKFINSLINQGHTVDTYIMLRIDESKNGFIQSNEGLDNFSEFLRVCNPVFLDFFSNFNESIYQPRYSNQIKAIDILIRKALEKKSYDYIIRIRPDCLLDGEFDLISLDPKIIYTSIKWDAIANDDFIIISKNMIEKWWIPIVRTSLSYVCDVKPDNSISPEYIIYNHMPVKEIITSGLVRDYDKIQSWKTNLSQYNIPKNYWFHKDSYFKLLKTIEFKEFAERLLKITEHLRSADSIFKV